MPNTPVWGNQGGDQNAEQDLITPENPPLGDPAVIRVNDVNNNDAARPAIYAENSNQGVNARALKVQGMAEIVANIPPFPNGQTIGLKVVHTTPASGSALDITGTSNFNGDVVVEGDVNTAPGSFATLKVNDVNEDDDAKIAAHFINSSANANARALVVEGPVEVKAGAGVLPNNSVRLIMGNCNIQCSPLDQQGNQDIFIMSPNVNHQLSVRQNVGVPGIRVDGGIQVSDNGEGSIFDSALLIRASATHQANIIISGNNHIIFDSMEIHDNEIYNTDDGAPINIGVHPGSGDIELSRPGKNTSINGTLVIDELAVLKGQLQVGDVNANGEIDARGGNDLDIGTQVATVDVTLSRAGQDVNVADDLNVGGDTTIRGNLIVGPPPPPGAAGQIDSGGSGALPQDLAIGGGAGTKDVTLSRAGRDVSVADDLFVGGNLDVSGAGRVDNNLAVEGELRVGDPVAAGEIDANGNPDPMNLRIGGNNTTADVLLGRVNQLIQMLTNLRMNGNRLILDADGNAWVEFNPDGQVPNFPSLDLAPDGQVRAYVDANGVHNA